MAKQLRFDADARNSLRRGVDKLANALRVTLGPRGRNVLIDRKYGSPTMTNDGVTIAKEIELEDPFENTGAQLLREVAQKTNEVAGDGTTTATVLAQCIFGEGLRAVSAGANPMQLKRGIDQAVATALASLKTQSKPVETRAERAAVAAISGNNDPAIGELIADALEKVGPEGVVTVEEARGMETELKFVEGMQLDKGYVSAYFVTDPEEMEAALDEPLILLYDKRISSIHDLLPVLEKASGVGAPLLLIAEDFEGE